MQLPSPPNHRVLQQQRLLLSFARRVCRRACCTRRRSGPMLVACGGPHSYCVHVQTLVDIGMLQALVACSCRTCGVHAACDLSLKAGRGHGRGACGVRVERIVFATERGTGLLLRLLVDELRVVAGTRASRAATPLLFALSLTDCTVELCR